MDINTVAKTTGLAASTLRYYEEKGLIKCSGRNGLKRVFSEAVLKRLALSSLGRSAGFSLDQINKMFTPEGPHINRDLLREKANELDIKIKELTSMRDGLRHAAACKAPDHFECPTFLRLLKIAGRNKFQKPGRLGKSGVKA